MMIKRLITSVINFNGTWLNNRFNVVLANVRR